MCSVRGWSCAVDVIHQRPIDVSEVGFFQRSMLEQELLLTGGRPIYNRFTKEIESLMLIEFFCDLVKPVATKAYVHTLYRCRLVLTTVILSYEPIYRLSSNSYPRPRSRGGARVDDVIVSVVYKRSVSTPPRDQHYIRVC